MKSKPVILLYGMEGAGLIIPRTSGVVYQNQTGGYSCLQDSLEGVFVPIDFQSVDHYKKFHRFFISGKWGGNCASGIDEETADFIDVTLACLPGYSGIKTDRSRLADSHEAWIYVRISDPQATGLMEGFDAVEAVLTWPNSD